MLDNFGNDEWRQGAGFYWEQHPSLKICGPVSLWLAECNYHHHWQQLHKASVDKNKMYAIKTCSFRLLLNPALVLLTHKSCVMTKKGFEGIKPVAGSYLGLLPTVCILSGHRTIIRPISWPATFPTSKDISPRSHCWVSWAYRTDFCIWHLAHHHFTSWFSQGTKFILKHDNIVDTIGTLLVTHSYPSFWKRCIWQKFSLLYKLPKR